MPKENTRARAPAPQVTIEPDYSQLPADEQLALKQKKVDAAERLADLRERCGVFLSAVPRLRVQLERPNVLLAPQKIRVIAFELLCRARTISEWTPNGKIKPRPF